VQSPISAGMARYCLSSWPSLVCQEVLRRYRAGIWSDTPRRTICGSPLTVRCGSEPLPLCYGAHGSLISVTSFVQRHVSLGLIQIHSQSLKSRQPGGSQVLVDHAGKDVTKLFEGIHPVGTLQSNLDERQHIGQLDDEGTRHLLTYPADFSYQILCELTYR
jgi:hypothetical protein